MTNPIWITGVGVGTPLGFQINELADNLLAGRSGVSTVTAFDASNHRCRVGAMLGRVPVPVGFDAVEFAKRDSLDQLALWCTANALKDAGRWDDRDRVGVVLGVGAEWLNFWYTERLAGRKRTHDDTPGRGSVLARLCSDLGLGGPAATVAAACASANVAFGIARRWIAAGWVDVCVAGGCDRSLTPVGLACFANLGALTTRNDDPTGASRPFDRSRDGFVMGEGGAMFVLESSEVAQRRGARPYAQFAGYGAASDAHHMVAPSPDPTYAVRAVRAALADARTNADDVDYVNAHATSTPLGDVAEVRVLREVFGAAADTVPVSATKSMTGHLLSGTSAVEAAACLIAIERGAIPPTVNLHDPDPECALRHVANSAWERRVDVAVSNSFGFGGSNSCVVLRRVA
ncbi:MAG: beta-ketoacyl-[acyl-carrier-protein] synthase family protein [Gemmataceae bacterium]